MRNLSILGGAALAAVAVTAVAQDAAQLSVDDWRIGPIIRGRSYSVGMPLNPTPERRGWSFEFPYPSVHAGHVHYVTYRHGPLWGASKIVMRYRIDAARGARFIPQEHPHLPATVSLYFQRAGDSWSARRHEHFRWYVRPENMRPVAPGEHEVTVSLSPANWLSINGAAASEHLHHFRAALAETDQVGFVFGSAAARGHGVYATAPARFTLIGFRVL